MRLEWTEQALEGFRNIRSHHYTPSETAEYKKRLLKNIQGKISLIGISIPAEKEAWKGSYKSSLINLLFIIRFQKIKQFVI